MYAARQWLNSAHVYFLQGRGRGDIDNDEGGAVEGDVEEEVYLLLVS